jgi:hypothetical protein
METHNVDLAMLTSNRTKARPADIAAPAMRDIAMRIDAVTLVRIAPTT